MTLRTRTLGLLVIAGAVCGAAGCSAKASNAASAPETDAHPSATSPVRTAQARRQLLSGHLSPEILRAPIIGRVPGTESMRVTLSLAAPDPTAIADAVAQVSDPKSPSYRRYLTPEEFGTSFGAADYEAVLRWAHDNHLLADAHPNRLVVNLSGNVSDIEHAFLVHMNYGLRPDGTRFYAPDAEPSLDLAVSVLHVSNLENFTLPHHAGSSTARSGSPASPQAVATPAQCTFLGGGDGGPRRGPDFRNAYAAGVSGYGSGQTVGIYMADGFAPSDFNCYVGRSGLPTPPSIQFVTADGNTGLVSNGSLEGTLDVDMVYSMAPAAQIVAFTSVSDPVAILSNMAKRPDIKQLTSSWFRAPSATEFQSELTLTAEFALQGQSYFQASGDNGAYTPNNGPSLNDFREVPFITIVGGTSLSLNGSSWANEIGWNGSSGGILASGNVPIPFYQLGLANAANAASSTYRNAPDVSAEASSVNIVYGGQESYPGGTSAATPLWAGFMALVNEKAAANGMGSVGFANPVLYSIASTPDYKTAFHDIHEGSCPCQASPSSNCLLNGAPASYNATTGYDLCTGLGSPQAALIDEIASPRASQTSPAMAALSGVLHMVYMSADPSKQLLHSSSSDGVNWTKETAIAGQSSAGAPSLAAFNGGLHMGFIADDAGHELLHAASYDGVNWGQVTAVPGHSSKAGPSLAAFNGRLYMAYLANDASNTLLYVSSPDGSDWGPETSIAGRSGAAAPSLDSFAGRLYLGYIENDASHALHYVSTADGANWTQEMTVPGHSSKTSPSLATYGADLYMFYLADNNTNDLLYVSSPDGIHWSAEQSIPSQSSSAAPNAIGFGSSAGSSLVVSYVSNDPRDLLLRTRSADGVNWSSGTVW